MRRRAFITLLSGAAAWPFAGNAQQGERMRRIGVLMTLAADDPEEQARVAAFQHGLEQLGWSIGRNIQIDYRWGVNDPGRHGAYAAEMVALAPDVILATSGPIVGALQKSSRTVPIVFVNTIDPVAGGWVASLARPGGNATGFTPLEFGMSGKWFELLKQMAPQIQRVAVIRDPTTPAGSGQFSAIHAVAPSFGVEVSPIDVRQADEIERAVTAFAQAPNGGLIVGSTSLAVVHRELIIALAARHRLPAIYPFRLYVRDGGLIAYGPDQIEPYRHAAGYVDRILRGEKPADLPVQAPTKYELAVNLKSAKVLGISMPPDMLARADEVVE